MLSRSFASRDQPLSWESAGREDMKEITEEIQFNGVGSGEAGDSSSAMSQQPRPVPRKTGRQASQSRSSHGGWLSFVFFLPFLYIWGFLLLLLFVPKRLHA